MGVGRRRRSICFGRLAGTLILVLFIFLVFCGLFFQALLHLAAFVWFVSFLFRILYQFGPFVGCEAGAVLQVILFSLAAHKNSLGAKE